MKNCPKKTLNPFESDQEEEINVVNDKSGLLEIKPNGKIVDVTNSNGKNYNETYCEDISKLNDLAAKRSSRKSSLTDKSQVSSSAAVKSTQANDSHVSENKSEELIEKAKKLIEKTKKPVDDVNNSSKREEIKQLAKQMIADTKKRKKSLTNSNKRESNNENQKKNDDLTNSNNNTNKNELNTTVDIVNSIQNDLDEKTKSHLIGTEYINQEIINLKNKQQELDEQGANLEKQLRLLMKQQKKSDQDKELEEILLKKWFILINDKNKLIFQQQELETLQNEKSLEKRYEILSIQLRNLMSIDDFEKTEEQKKTETILFNELIFLVNKRNELVLQMDEENKLLNDEEQIGDYIKNTKSFKEKEKQCSIQ